MAEKKKTREKYLAWEVGASVLLPNGTHGTIYEIGEYEWPEGRYLYVTHDDPERGTVTDALLASRLRPVEE